MKFLYIMDQGIGNMIMATPALRALRNLYPSGQIDVWGQKPALETIKKFSAVDNFVTPDDIKDDYPVIYDIAICSVWSQGFLKQHRAWLENHSKQMLNIDVHNWEGHESDYQYQMIQGMGYLGEKPGPYCHVKKCKIDIPSTYVVIGDTSLPGWERKRYPHYPQLAELFMKDNYNVVVVGGEYEEFRHLPDDWPKGIHTFFAKPLGELAYLIKNADLYIGNDSGIAHIAGCVGTKTHVIYGATSIMKNKPLGDKVYPVKLDWHCSPCQYKPWWTICQETECMTKLESKDVYDLLHLHEDIKIVPEQVQCHQKLVAIVRVRKGCYEESRLLECLNSLKQFTWRTVVILNDLKSEDIAFWKTKGYDASFIDFIETKGYDEGRDYNSGLKRAKEFGAEWIMCIEDGFVFEGRFNRRKMQELMSDSKMGCYWFRLFHFWNDENKHRIDQRWKPIHSVAMFRNTPEVTFSDDKVHAALQNIKGQHKNENLHIRNYGYLRAKIRGIKYKERVNILEGQGTFNLDYLKDTELIKLADWEEEPKKRQLGNLGILLVMMHGAGDNLMLSPTIRQMKKNNPDLSIGLLVLGKQWYNKAVWQNHPLIDYVFESSIDHHPTYWDAVIFNQEDRPIIDGDVEKLQNKYRFDNVVFVSMQEDRNLHRIDRLAKQLRVNLESPKMEIFPNSKEIKMANEFLKKCKIKKKDFVVTLHRSAKHRPKSWDFEECKKLAMELTKLGIKVIMLDIDEEERGEGFIEGDNIYSIRELPEQSPQITSEIIKRANLHIGSDSLPMHIANAVFTPTIGLFKSTWMHETGPATVNSCMVATRMAFEMANKDWMNANRERVIQSGLEIRSIDVLKAIQLLSNKGFIKFDKELTVSIQDIPNKAFDPNDGGDPIVDQVMSDLFAFFQPIENSGLLYNPGNWFRFSSFFRFLQMPKEARILDVGSGLSIWPFFLASKGFDVTCIDPAEHSKIKDISNQLNIPIHVFPYDITEAIDEFEAKPFDIVTCLSVFEHIEDDTKAIQNIAKMLKPGGVLYSIVDFYSKYIEYPDANREIVKDKEEGHCDSRIYDKDALVERLIQPSGMEMVGKANFENIDINNPQNRAVRGLYSFARFFLKKGGK